MNIFLSTLFSSLAFFIFPRASRYILVLFPLIFYLFSKALEKLLARKNYEVEEEEFSQFISYLSSRVSSGGNLELCLIKAREKLAGELEENSRMYKQIHRLSLAIYSGLDLRNSLAHFASVFSHKSIQTFAYVLPSILELGGNYSLFLQLQRDSLQKNLELYSEIKAKQSASLMEAFIMSLMPFIMALLIGRSNYLVPIADFAYLPLLEALLLVLSTFGLYMSLSMLSKREYRIKFPKLYLLSFRTTAFAPMATRLCERIYGFSPMEKIRRTLHYFEPKRIGLLDDFCATKCCFFILPFFVFLISPLPPLFLLFPFLFFFLPDARLRDSMNKIKQAEIMEYPTLLNLLSILLESGLSLDRALRLCLVSFRENRPEERKPDKLKSSRPSGKTEKAKQKSLFKRKTSQKIKSKKKTCSLLSFDLSLLQESLESGIPADKALENLANRRFQSDIAQTLHLMTRYAREGSDDQVQMIKVQALRSTDNYRNNMHETLAKRGLSLLLPISYELLLVMAIAALPAIIQINM